jgi:hypothetical protein
MKTSLVASLLFALALYAGASPGANPRIDESALAAMRQGHTTYDEIVRRFGRPNFTSTNWNGTRTAAYAYGEGWSPGALSALSAAIGSSSGDTVVLHFNDKGVLMDYRINHAAVRPADSPAAPPARYVEPSFGGSVPSAASRPAATTTVNPDESPPAVEPPTKPAAAQATKPERRTDGLPSWLPSSSTRENRY